MFETEIGSEFSAGLFVFQLFAIPLLSLTLGLLVAAPLTTGVSVLFTGEGKESLPGEIAAYAAYAAVGGVLGLVAQRVLPRAARSGAKWVWIPPVSLLALGMAEGLVREGSRAIPDLLAPSLDASAGERGIVFILLTMPAVACVCYSFAIMTVHGRRPMPSDAPPTADP
jgi:hypothetical protein